ncbi:hypothetical protein [Salidesulfovibrio onnuriiensis]|uniref:hypothetical protein n=1 Tax=Salidesulfovibrio onnuriiensis TaxID=2583823 RepID=UPI0011CAFCF2|nr:hypothetical protein [Salidesulfovibrio onnuriiensis]
MPHTAKSHTVLKYTAFILTGVVLLLLVAGGYAAYRTKSQVGTIFRLNEARKAEGYYLSEFEFQMLGAAYHLDQGNYLTAFSILDALEHQLETGRGLIKTPKFDTAKQKLEFYRSLQNPETGAFMTSGFPLFTYIGPTANMIEFIEDLSREAGEQFALNHNLAFFDDIDTPEKLRAFLDDASHVGRVGAMFKTPYVCVAELNALVEQCERLGIRSFAPEWKQALYGWFYEDQSPETGLWGSRWRGDNTQVDGGSLTDSEKVIKMFVDFEGNDLHAEYPLRHHQQLIRSALDCLSTPQPDDLDELHEWIMINDRGFRFLTRYLWRHVSAQDRTEAEKLMEAFIRFRFDNYYVAEDGAFSLYPEAKRADMDGTGEAYGMLQYLGVTSPQKQEKIWGQTMVNLGKEKTAAFTLDRLAPVAQMAGVNSVRLYAANPQGRYLENVLGVWYPQQPQVLDAVDVLARIRAWAEKTPQDMGNWVTRESVLNWIGQTRAAAAPVLEKGNETILKGRQTMFAMGFDILQRPRCRMTLEIGD